MMIDPSSSSRLYSSSIITSELLVYLQGAKIRDKHDISCRAIESKMSELCGFIESSLDDTKCRTHSLECGHHQQERRIGRGINKVILVGNLGSDPEVRVGQNSTFATLSVATNEQ